jgi:hypothetical protein
MYQHKWNGGRINDVIMLGINVDIGGHVSESLACLFVFFGYRASTREAVLLVKRLRQLWSHGLSDHYNGKLAAQVRQY